MYRGFNLKLGDHTFLEAYQPKKQKYSYSFISENKKFKEKLNTIKEKPEILLKNTKKPEVLLENSKNGTKIQNKWFPKIEADIFISHSHKDLELAKNLAYWLEDTFRLKSFIDSDVWRYGDDLIKILDDKYSKIQNDSFFDSLLPKENEEHYNYNIRNQTTSHVHIMLTTALTNMITNSKAFFFLNTSNSILNNLIEYGSDEKKTHSPWIYHELNVIKMILKLQKKIISSSKQQLLMESIDEDLSYDASLKDLITINNRKLKSWSEKYEQDKFKGGCLSSNSLGCLYEILNLD